MVKIKFEEIFSFQTLDNILNYPYKYPASIAPVFMMYLVFYGGKSGPKLPSFIKELFENPVFRVFVLSLIVYKGNKNPTIAIIIALLFTLVMDLINKQNFVEGFKYRLEKFSNDKIENNNELSGVKSTTDLSSGPTEFHNEDLVSDKKDIEKETDKELEKASDDDELFSGDGSCNGYCSKISYNDFQEKIKSDEFSQEYFNSIKDCMVVDLLQDKSGNELNKILKRMDLTHNDIDGPIGTAYVNYNDAVSRLNI
jgi:hypothetical protein